jgi:hypothetical protein
MSETGTKSATSGHQSRRRRVAHYLGSIRLSLLPIRAFPGRPPTILFAANRFAAMRYDAAIIDRQIGRNAELFAESIAEIDSKEERYPYLRILVSLVEQAHPEWKSSPNKAQQYAELITRLSKDTLDEDEVTEVVQMRDRERGR